MKVNLSLHAITRCQQRGFKESDIDLITEYGTPTAGGILLTGKNIVEVEHEYKRILHRLQKLKNTFLATTTDDGLVKTVFRTTKKQRRKQTYSW